MTAKIIYQELHDVDAKYFKSEDSGCALILDDLGGTEFMGDGFLFVRVQSWDDDKKHPLLNSLAGKTIRITIEVED